MNETAQKLLDEKKESLELARAKADRLANAFKDVFGLDSKHRSESQALVLAHLEVCSGGDGNDFRFTEGRDGVAIAIAGFQLDGARSILRVIDRQLKIASNVRTARKDKPVAKR